MYDFKISGIDLDNSGWFTVNHRRDYFTAILMHRCVTGTAPVYLSDKFKSSHGSGIITMSQTNKRVCWYRSQIRRCLSNLFLVRDPEFGMVCQLVVEGPGILKILRTWLSLSLKHSHYICFNLKFNVLAIPISVNL